MPVAKLYIIATPLGNRGDITLRALEALRSLPIFFAEDTREFLKLLDLYDIAASQKKVHSYASHNLKEATRRALEILHEGHDIGFVSDRGTPGISDPGAFLAEKAREEGFEVLPIPGPSSVTSALSVSGFLADRFLFLGFLSTTQSERKKNWDDVEAIGWPACFFESPQRVRKTLKELAARFPQGRIFCAREMTKKFETYTLSNLQGLDLDQVIEKGEYTVVLDPGRPPVSSIADWEGEIQLRLSPDKAWAKALAERYQVSASEIYNALQREKTKKD